MTPQETNDLVDRAFRDPMVIKAAIERGIDDAIKQHAQAGRLLPSWRDNRVVFLDPVTLQEVPAPTLATTTTPQ